MKFGDIPLAKAEGAILAHSLRLGTAAVLKKGRVLSPEDIALIAASGLDHIVAARLEPGDIREDAAATRIAAAAARAGIATAAGVTGRADLVAAGRGPPGVAPDPLPPPSP